MPKIYIKTSIRTIEDYWDGEQYGDWREEYSYEGLTVFQSSQAGELGVYTREIEVDFEPQIGQLVFPVIVSYGSGNTFGHSSGNIEIVGIYDTADRAQHVRNAIEEDYKNSGGYELEVDGQKIYTYNWKGYFECLEWVRVETELVRA